MSKSFNVVFVCFACVCAESVRGSECVDVWEAALWACIIMCGEVCVCLYIYEVLVQTFNLPQPSECAKRRLSRCAATTLFALLCLPAFLLFHKSPTLICSTPLPHSLRSAPSPLFLHLMLRLILELLPWIPASSWRCLSTPAQEHLSWMCTTEHAVFLQGT